MRRISRSQAGPGDDATMITRSLRDPRCFATLFDRHAPHIHRYLVRRIGPDAAEDALAEAFLVAFEKRARYDTSYRDARPWLYGIAANVAGQHRREEARRLTIVARSL